MHVNIQTESLIIIQVGPTSLHIVALFALTEVWTMVKSGQVRTGILIELGESFVSDHLVQKSDGLITFHALSNISRSADFRFSAQSEYCMNPEFRRR
jgi:hypothetical protein